MELDVLFCMLNSLGVDGHKKWNLMHYDSDEMRAGLDGFNAG